jgi:hypothetical protein
MPWTALGTGLLGLAACAAGILLFPSPLFRGYLVAYQFWLGITLGSLALLMIYHLTGGGWGLLLRRLLESSTRTLPLMAILFLPLLPGLDELYVWARAAGEGAHPEGKFQWYLTVPGFIVRAVIYFAVWLGLAWFLNRWSREQDQRADPRLTARMATLSGPGLVVFVLTLTLATVDWVMSLQPHWFSTIFAVIFGVAQLLAALALAIVVLYAFSSSPALARLISSRYSRDLGNLLLTFVMVWIYVVYSQFFLIWIGNLPEEIVWYLPRLAGGWEGLLLGVLGLQFALPFLLLLFRGVKQRLWSLAGVGAIILVTYLVNLFWQIVPAFPPAGLLNHWPDAVGTIVGFLGVGGIWVAAFLQQLRNAPLVAPHDPTLEAVTAHG